MNCWSVKISDYLSGKVSVEFCLCTHNLDQTRLIITFSLASLHNGCEGCGDYFICAKSHTPFKIYQWYERARREIIILLFIRALHRLFPTLARLCTCDFAISSLSSSISFVLCCFSSLCKESRSTTRILQQINAPILSRSRCICSTFFLSWLFVYFSVLTRAGKNNDW